jgi:hypothetical protein
MASDATMAKAYEQLTPTERFRLSIEAMARKDWAEVDRLEDTCPRRTYRCEDEAFRDRMRHVHLLTLYHALWVEGPLAQVRLFEAMAKGGMAAFARPVEKAAEVAFLYGREYGKWQAGVIERIDLPDKAALAAECKADPELRRQLIELRQAVGEAMKRVAADLADAIKTVALPDIAVKQQGFGRFCRETLGLDPATLLTALDTPPSKNETVAADPAKVAECAGGGTSGGRGGSQTRYDSKRAERAGGDSPAVGQATRPNWAATPRSKLLTASPCPARSHRRTARASVGVPKHAAGWYVRASLASADSGSPHSTATGTSDPDSRNTFSTSRPLASGSDRSSTTRCGSKVFTNSRAAAAVSAGTTE